MTKRELIQNITSTFEKETMSLFDAYNHDEEMGGRRIFNIDTEFGTMNFEYSRTGFDMYCRENSKHVNPTAQQVTKINCALELENKLQLLMNNTVKSETEKYEQSKQVNN
jgi:hypothetical protein